MARMHRGLRQGPTGETKMPTKSKVWTEFAEKVKTWTRTELLDACSDKDYPRWVKRIVREELAMRDASGQ